MRRRGSAARATRDPGWRLSRFAKRWVTSAVVLVPLDGPPIESGPMAFERLLADSGFDE